MLVRNGDNIEVRNGSRQTSIPALNVSEPCTFQSVGEVGGRDCSFNKSVHCTAI